MDILTGLLLDYALEKSLVNLTIVDESGSRNLQTFSHGKYNLKDFAAFKNQNVIIKFEKGNEKYPKLIQIQYILSGISSRGKKKHNFSSDEAQKGNNKENNKLSALSLEDRIEITYHPIQKYIGKNGVVIYVGSSLLSNPMPVNEEYNPEQKFKYSVKLDDGTMLHDLQDIQIRKL
jgi:hypothetical protein